MLEKGLRIVALSLGVLLSHTVFAYASSVENLPGYSRMTVGEGFEKYLKENPTILKSLRDNTALSREVLRNASLQSQLLHGKITVPEIAERLRNGEKIRTQKTPDEQVEKAKKGAPAAAPKADNQAQPQTTPATASPLPTEKVQLTHDIAANLVLANEVANNPALAGYFERNPDAYKKVLNGEMRLDEIRLNDRPIASRLTGKGEIIQLADARMQQPAHLETDISCIGFDITFD